MRKELDPAKIVAQVERRREYNRNRMRKYRVEHPDRILHSRLQQARNLLVKHGYVVIEADAIAEAGADGMLRALRAKGGVGDDCD